MKNTFLFNLLVAVSFVTGMTLTAFSQDKVMPPAEQNHYSLSPTGDVQNPMLSLTPPPQKEFSAEKKVLLRQLREARLSNDLNRSNEVRSQLNKMEGVTPFQTPSDPRIQSQVINNPNEPDYVTSTIFGIGNWANAVATVPVGAPNAGRIYVATSQFAAGGGDSCKFYYSTNGGVSWVYYTQFWFTGNTDFRANELDIEIVYDGTTAWLYGVGGFGDITANNLRVVFFRWNLTTNAFYGIIMAWPGAVGSNLYYNPRIVSDFPLYTSNAYVYITAAFDSTTGGTQLLRTKFADIQDPFATTPTVLYPQANAGGFWWFASGQPAGRYLYTDVGFYNDAGGTGSDRVYVVSCFTLVNNNIFTAWSDDYGVTNAGSLTITETVETRGARIAFNGGTANRNGMIVYLRNFGSADWDVRYQNTTNGGTTGAGWTAGYIDFTTFHASGRPDVIRQPGAANLFKAAYCEDSSGVKGFYAGFNGTAWATPSRLSVTNVAQDSTFGNIVAGFRNGGGDDCLAVWRGSNAFTYASYLCQTTVGIGNNNETPLTYSLSQNYPNPFNPTTLINYSIPVAGKVKLAVYNLLGEEVASLVNEFKTAGKYSIEFNASQFASGVYFYKLESANFSDTKKLMLIK